jgi:hypothetical protein
MHLLTATNAVYHAGAHADIVVHVQQCAICWDIVGLMVSLRISKHTGATCHHPSTGGHQVTVTLDQHIGGIRTLFSDGTCPISPPCAPPTHMAGSKQDDIDNTINTKNHERMKSDEH